MCKPWLLINCCCQTKCFLWRVFFDGWWEQHHTKYLKYIYFVRKLLINSNIVYDIIDNITRDENNGRGYGCENQNQTECDRVCVCVHCVDAQQVVIDKLNCLVINRRRVKTLVVENKTKWEKKSNLFIKWISTKKKV